MQHLFDAALRRENHKEGGERARIERHGQTDENEVRIHDQLELSMETACDLPCQ
jgi:hypothetical protein